MLATKRFVFSGFFFCCVCTEDVFFFACMYSWCKLPAVPVELEKFRVLCFVHLPRRKARMSREEACEFSSLHGVKKQKVGTPFEMAEATGRPAGRDPPTHTSYHSYNHPAARGPSHSFTIFGRPDILPGLQGVEKYSLSPPCQLGSLFPTVYANMVSCHARKQVLAYQHKLCMRAYYTVRYSYRLPVTFVSSSQLCGERRRSRGL